MKNINSYNNFYISFSEKVSLALSSCKFKGKLKVTSISRHLQNKNGVLLNLFLKKNVFEEKDFLPNLSLNKMITKFKFATLLSVKGNPNSCYNILVNIFFINQQDSFVECLLKVQNHSCKIYLL